MKTRGTASRLWIAVVVVVAAALAAAVVAGFHRDVVFRLGPEDHARSVERFATGLRELKVNPRLPWARVPRVLPGPADDWAGGTAHAVTWPLGQRPVRGLVLDLSLAPESRLPPTPRPWARDHHAPLPVQPEQPAWLTVAVNADRVATGGPPSGEWRQRVDRDVRGTYRIRIPSTALGDGSSVRLSLVNEAGPAVFLERVRLVESTPTFAWHHLGRRGPFPPAGAGFLALSLAALLVWNARGAGTPADRVRRSSGPFVILALVAMAGVAPTAWLPLASLPRWLWLSLPWLALALFRPRRSATRLTVRPVGASRARMALAKGALVIVSLTLSLVAAEFGLRLVLRHVTSARDARAYFHQVIDEHNSLGFREREFPLRKPPHTYRIAVIGDSLTQANGVARADRFSDLIERRLSEKDSGLAYEVLNFGRTGWDTEQEVEVLRTLVWQVNPDSVLLQWYVNDFENGQVADRPRPVALVPWERLHQAILRRRSILYTLLEDQWVRLQGHLGLTETYAAYMYARFGDPEGAESMYAVDRTREFIDECKRRHVPVSIVLFPHVDPSLAGGGPSTYGYLHDRVLDVCRQEEIRCVDLRSTFAAEADYRKLWVNKFDPHPSGFAHRLAAERIVATLEDIWVQAPRRRFQSGSNLPSGVER